MKKLQPFTRTNACLQAINDYEYELKGFENNTLKWLEENIDIDCKTTTAIKPSTQLRMVKTEIARRAIAACEINNKSRVDMAIETICDDQFRVRIDDFNLEEIMELREKLWQEFVKNWEDYPHDLHEESVANASNAKKLDAADKVYSIFGAWSARQSRITSQLYILRNRYIEFKRLSKMGIDNSQIDA